MSKPAKSAVPKLIIGSAVLCIGLLLLAFCMTRSDPNETWSGWLQAIGSVAAISVGWIVAIWQREEEDERKLADRHDTAAVVGWRIFTSILQVMVTLRQEFNIVKRHRHGVTQHGQDHSNPPFNRLRVPDVLLSAWPEFQHFPGEIGPALAQALGRVETYNQNARIDHPVSLDFIEEQQLMLYSMYRSLRSIHADLGIFLEEDRVRRSEAS